MREELEARINIINEEAKRKQIIVSHSAQLQAQVEHQRQQDIETEKKDISQLIEYSVRSRVAGYDEEDEAYENSINEQTRIASVAEKKLKELKNTVLI